MNGLARDVADISSSQVQYKQHVDKLQKKWKDEWRGQGLTSSPDNGEGTCDSLQCMRDDR